MLSRKMEVRQVSPGRFKFNLPKENSNKARLYIKDEIEKDDKEFLLETSKSSFEVEIGDLDFRPYFIIESKDSENILAERSLPIEGMHNFRDMGGYETYHGKKVKWGSLYRSDHFYNVTKSGLKYLEGLDLKTIIDYRSSGEIKKYPNKLTG